MNKARKQSSTSYPIPFFMVDSSDHVTAKTGLTVTVTLSKNGGAFAAVAGAVSEIGNGWYALAGNATDRNTLGELLVHASASGADPFDGQYSIVDFDPFVFKPPVSLAPADCSGNIPAVVKAQDNIDFGAMQKASITAAVPTVAQNRQEMDSNSTKLASILEDTGTTIPALINASGGAGSILHSYTITDSADGTPIDGVEVWVSTDAAGVNVVASGYTNSSGVFSVMLDAGTYYFWRKRSGYNFVNPDQETVSA